MPQDKFQDEIKKLLPGITSFTLDSAEKLNLATKNFIKFEKTAPAYEPPVEDFSTFENNIEALGIYKPFSVGATCYDSEQRGSGY